MGINDQINRFFAEFSTPKNSNVVWATVVGLMILVLMGIYSNYRLDPDVTFACTIYLFMAFFVMIIGGLDSLKESIYFAASVTAGKFKWAGFGGYPFWLGLVFGAIMVAQNQTIGLSFLQLSGTQAFLFIVIIAPFVEEWFFRGTFFPSLNQALSLSTRYHALAALAVTNVSFGMFHWYVYGANLAAIYIVIALGTIYTIGNYACKSTGFSLAAHTMNNLLLWMAAGGVFFG